MKAKYNNLEMVLHVAGVGEPSVSEVEQLWLNEAEKRLDDYRTGTIQGIPGNAVFKRAVAELL